MSRMIFDLTEEDREALEAIRKNRGHRSQAETLRELIRQAASSGLPAPERQAEMKAYVVHKQRAASAVSVSVPVFDGGKRPAYQKRQKR